MKKILILACLYLVIGCKKDNAIKDDFSGTYTITGSVYKTNSLTGDSSVLANEKVYLKHDNQAADDYLYYVTTDAEGKFVFKNIDGKRTSPRYIVYVRSNFMDTADEYYAADTISTERFDKADDRELHLLLNATFDISRQTGLLIHVKDEKGGSIPGAKVNIFLSEKLALLDTITFAGTGANFTLTTDSFGRVFVSRINAGSILYINSWFKIGDIILSNKLQQAEITIGNIAPLQITLKPAPVIEPSKPAVLLLKITDEHQGSISGATVNVFYSQVLANYDTANFDGGGATYRVVSDSSGRVLLANVPLGKVYVNAKFDVDSTTRLKATLNNATIVDRDTTILNISIK